MDREACTSQTKLINSKDKLQVSDFQKQPQTQQQPSQRCRKRLVASASSGASDERNRFPATGGHSHDKVLRSHTRRATSGVTSGEGLPRKLLRSSGTGPKQSSFPSKEESHSQDEYCELVSSPEEGERRKRGGGTEWSGMRGLNASSSSCSLPTNETNELCEQAGLGGTTTTKATTTNARVRRTSAAATARTRSRRGECSFAACPLDVATQSTTSTATITANSSNNTSDSPQTMNSVVGDGETGRNPEESCDEQEMCQEDDASSAGHGSCELPAHSATSSASPKPFSSSGISVGDQSACRVPVKKEQNEGTEKNSLQFKTDKGTVEGKCGGGECLSATGRKLIYKAAVDKAACDGKFIRGNGNESLGNSPSLKIQKSNDKWNVENRRKDEDGREENLFTQSVCGNVSMPLAKAADDAGKDGDRGVGSPAPASSSKLSTRTLRKAQERSHGCPGESAGGSVNSDKSHFVTETASKTRETRKKSSVPAPMLLMNNLPYMGELTFDTRPRRGRKPKKADICHLISKNYGIQFPMSYVNMGATAAPSQSQSPQTGRGQSTKSNHSKRANNGNGNNSSATNAGAPPISGPTGTIPVARPVPAFSNKDVSIVPIIPSTWSPQGGQVLDRNTQSCVPVKSLVKPLSLAQQLMLRPSVIPNSSSQQAISMFPLPVSSSSSHRNMVASPYKSEDDEDGEVDEDCATERINNFDKEEERDSQDGPLNLCMRDSSRYKAASLQPLSLCTVKQEAEERAVLDVRWRKGGGSVARGEPAQFEYPPGTIQQGASKRNLTVIFPEGEGLLRKGSKSAKMCATQASSNSNNNIFANGESANNRSSSSVSNPVGNLVRVDPIPSLSPASSVFKGEQRGRGLQSATFPVSHHHSVDTISGVTGKGNSYSQLGGSVPGNKGGKQCSNRKKKEPNPRGEISISSCTPGQMGNANTSATSGGLSSFGGTLFGQSTSGINDGAEVSICKFKFTGGAKPCLQEKKMLSVDSGGNFRFYTDKAAGGAAAKVGKGQQLPSSSSATITSYSSTTNTFSASQLSLDGTATDDYFSLPKSAKSMSMCMPFAGNSMGTVTSGNTKISSPVNILPASTSVSTGISLPLPISPATEELQQLHLSMNHGHNHNASVRVSPYLPGEYSYSSSNSCSSSDNSNENMMQEGGRMEVSPGKSGFGGAHAGSHQHRHGTGGKLKRKRRTRKSLMREKLEKTFKEKGFLIQTQQLQSAEGATYCKFRQLRKFTRYLFRSWKDYLPDHVKEISDKSNNGNENGGGNLPGCSQAAAHRQSNADEKSLGGLANEDEPEAQINNNDEEDMDDSDDADCSDKEESKNEDLISEKALNKGSSSSDDENTREEQAVLIEASRAQAQQSLSHVPNSSPLVLWPNDVKGNDQDDEDEELHIDL